MRLKTGRRPQKRRKQPEKGGEQCAVPSKMAEIASSEKCEPYWQAGCAPCEKAGEQETLRSAAMACERPARPAAGAGQSCGPSGRGRSRRWRRRQTSKSRRNCCLLELKMGVLSIRYHPTKLAFMRVAGTIQGRGRRKNQPHYGGIHTHDSGSAQALECSRCNQGD